MCLACTSSRACENLLLLCAGQAGRLSIRTKLFAPAPEQFVYEDFDR